MFGWTLLLVLVHTDCYELIKNVCLLKYIFACLMNGSLVCYMYHSFVVPDS